MKKLRQKTLIALLFLFCVNTLPAQVWNTVGDGFRLTDVVSESVGGWLSPYRNGASLYHNGDLYVIVQDRSGNASLFKWNGLSWSSIPSPFGSKLLLFQNEIYLTSGNLLFKLNGTSWTNLNAPVVNGVFTDMEVFNNEIVLGGTFSSSLSDKLIKFDGTNFLAMPITGINFVEQIEEFNNELYISSGGFNMAETVLKLQGSSWVKAANYFTGTANATWALSLFSYNGSLFAQNTNNANGDFSLYELGNDTLFNKGNVQFQILDYTQYNNEMYFVGPDSIFGPYLRKFDGTNFTTISNTPKNLISVDSVNGELFILGGRDSIYNGVKHRYAYRTSPNYSVIDGTVYNDVNGDCFQNPTETGIGNIIVPLVGQVGTVSTNSGFYSASLPAGTYSFGQIYSPLPVNKNLNSNCSLPNPITIGANQTLTQNIAMKNNVAKDLAITLQAFQGWRARYGFNEQYKVSLSNAGNLTVLNAEFDLVVPSTIVIDSIVPSATSIAGNTYTFNMLNLNPTETREIMVYATIDTSMNSLGDSLVWDVATVGFSGDADVSDNSFKLKLLVAGAYDPNDKQASAYRILPSTSKIDYHIRFQNTGTDTAYKVVVVDTLDVNLPLTNVMINSTSHPYSLSIIGNVLIWTFDNILLPDSGANYLESHGYVNFSTGINMGLAIGDTIVNKAEIYFDFQPPIITNHAKTAVVQYISVEENASKYLELKVYPNPAKDFIIVENTATASMLLTVTDIQGRLVKTLEIAANGKTQIDLLELSVGTYILASGELKYKLIVTQ